MITQYLERMVIHKQRVPYNPFSKLRLKLFYGCFLLSLCLLIQRKSDNLDVCVAKSFVPEGFLMLESPGIITKKILILFSITN